MKLIVATGNPGKLREMREYLEGLEWELQLKPPEIEVKETGSTFEENSYLKASQVARAVGEWAIADDSGLEVDALDGAPGIYSARYASTDTERIERVLHELKGTENRQAQFVCAITVCRPDGTVAVEATGKCRGEILEESRGESGFGYDPIFYVPEYRRTFAQMKPEVKRKTSHRGRAFARLISKLRAVSSF